LFDNNDPIDDDNEDQLNNEDEDIDGDHAVSEADKSYLDSESGTFPIDFEN